MKKFSLLTEVEIDSQFSEE